MRHLLVLLAFLGLVGCGGTPSTGLRGEFPTGPVEVASSRQTTTGNEVRQRSKVHADLGRVYMMQGRYDIALEEAKIAMEADSSYAPSHNLNALIHMALQRNDQAETSFRDALRLAPNDPEINNDYGWFLCQSDRPRDALAHFKVAIGNPLFQTPVKALTNAGLCSRAMGDDKQAEDYLVRAVRGDRANVVAIYHLADINYLSGRYMDARQRINDLHVQLGDPTAESAWLALRIERKLGDRENEARYTGVLRRKYRNSAEYLKLTRGEFD